MPMATAKEETGSRNDSCSRCKKARSAWLQNREGFRAYCCWGCADDSGCICGRKTHRRVSSKDENAAPLRLSIGNRWSKKRRMTE